MDWLVAASLGAIGGAIGGAINLYGLVSSWQAARHEARRCGEPKLREFVDVPADTLVGLTRRPRSPWVRRLPPYSASSAA